MSITYFKRLYPKSKIIGFEPDPKIFETLQKNLSCFEGKNLELHEKAVWYKRKHSLLFTPDNADGGTIDKDGSIRINTVNLNQFLQEEVDFLKIDIEAEHELLPAISANLRNVKISFLELHLDQSVPKQIEEIFKLLRENFCVFLQFFENISFDLLQKLYTNPVALFSN